MSMEENKSYTVNGDKKVKVGVEFTQKIRNFWKNIFHRDENKKPSFLEKIGAKITKLVTNDQNKKEEETKELMNEMKEDVLKLIERLNTEKLDEVDINDIVDKIQTKKKRLSNDLETILKSNEIKDKNKIRIMRDEMYRELEEKLNKAKEVAQKNMIKHEKIEKAEGVKAVKQFGTKPKTKAQTMKAVEDDAPTAIPVQEPDLDEPNIDIPTTFEKNEENDLNKEPGNIIEESSEEKETEEPFVSEGIDITDEISNDIHEIDLSKCSDWYDYVAMYFAQSGIDMKDVHRFYKDIDRGNYPSDFLDKREFATEKQRMEDEIEYRKLESERAEAEKRLREIEEKQAALSEEHAELQARFDDRDAKLSALRKDNISLKQQLVDKEGQIKNNNQEIKVLQGQLTSAQEVAKKAQAQSYKDRKALSDIEKELYNERIHAKELEQMLQKSEKTASETKRELEATKARISENAKVALERIESLRIDDDLEKTALDWGKQEIKKYDEQDQMTEKEVPTVKRKPKHFAETKSEETPKTDKVEEPEKKEENINLPTFDIPASYEPQVVGISTTPDTELQGIVTQDKDGLINFETKPLEEIQSEREELEAKRADLVSAIEKEAGDITNSEENKIR